MAARVENPEVNGAAEEVTRIGRDASVVRVLHLNAGNMYGGVETFLTTLGSQRHLCPGMEPHFATCYAGRSSRELTEAGVPVYTLGPVRISRPWTIWRARRRLRELLARERFDLVICHMSWTMAIFGKVARRSGHRVAMWAHGFQSVENWLDRIARRTEPDFVIANSRFTAAWVRNQFPNTPVHVVYCPVAPVESPDADRSRAALRQEQEVDEDTVVILQVGRLETWKGHLVHLRALALLDPAKKWVCWIAGGPQTSEQQEYLRQLQLTASQLGISGRVKFLGQRTDVPKLLGAADIFCQPNEGPEPFGLVFIEALWAGRPVITSSLGGALEIVDETCGLLVKPGEAEGLAESLQRLIAAPALRLQLGRAGPARARRLCDPASQMDQLRVLSAISQRAGQMLAAGEEVVS
jgi:glycosyltransferase involved in cell wall biosynthesis